MQDTDATIMTSLRSNRLRVALCRIRSIASLIVESVDPEGPYGAKEAGEGPLHPSLPAIANAIWDAVGVRMDSLPFTPDRVWRALNNREGG